MSIAFYAPMKPLDHPVPSGDRRMARNLASVLTHCGLGAVKTLSRFRSYDGSGDAHRQIQINRVGVGLAARLIRHMRTLPSENRPKVWFTYHLYHKAPDHIGPSVSRALGIPYVVAEASHAPKQRGGPWDIGYRCAEQGIRHADRIICLNPADRPCLEDLVRNPAETLVDLAPFVDLEPFSHLDAQPIRAAMAESHGIDPDKPWLLAVGMMRPGDKTASYTLLAKALDALQDQHGIRPQLLVVGDGPMRTEIETVLKEHAPLFFGLLDAERLAPVYAASDLLVWPAVNEAYGMAILEAQATGLPVIAGNNGGVAGVVAHGKTGLLTPGGDAAAFAAATAQLLQDPARRIAMGTAAKIQVRDHHSPLAAARVLQNKVFLPLLGSDLNTESAQSR